MKRPLALILFLLLGVTMAHAVPSSAARILAEARAASGGAAWNEMHSLQAEGTIATGGLSGTWTELQDCESGRSVSRYRIGDLEGAQGFDGTLGWIVSPTREVTPMDSPEGRRTTADAAYVAARGWWFPRRWPATITVVGKRKEGAATYQVLDITPRAGRRFELWIDARTHLVARTVEATGIAAMQDITYFGDYRTVKGLKLAFRERHSQGEPQYDTVVQLQNVALNVPVNGREFAMPRQQLYDYSFAGGAGEATIPFKLLNNHIYIAVTVNGHPLQFLVDSGGFNLLTPQAASLARVTSLGALQAIGLGGKSVMRERIGRAESLTLGGKVQLRNQIFAIVPMPGFNNVEGTRFDGLVGYQLFYRLVVRIDYASETLTLMPPSRFKPASAGVAVPFTLLGRMPGMKGPKVALAEGATIPRIHGSIDGSPGEFEIDTGSRNALTLWGPFASAHDLVTREHASPEIVVGWGLGGSVRGRVARGGTLMIGTIAVRDPLMDLSAGNFDPTFIAGNIGGEILRQFTLTFDYAHRVIYFKTGRYYGETMTFDRSGMWINAHRDGFLVESVMSGGPADRAGLRVGELITAVDGKRAASLTVSGVRRMLRERAPGTRIELTIGRGKAARVATLMLRAFPFGGISRKIG